MLGFAFSFSQCLLTAIDPNRVHSCCVFQQGAVIVAFISHLISHWSYPLPQWPSVYSYFSPFILSRSICLRCFWTRHHLLCQKFQCGELYFNTKQHHLLCSTSGQGSHSQWVDTCDKAEKWSGAGYILQTFSEVPTCVYVSCGHHRPHWTSLLWCRNRSGFWIAVFLLVSGCGFEWERFPLGWRWQPSEKLLYPPSSLLSTSLCHYLL